MAYELKYALNVANELEESFKKNPFVKDIQIVGSVSRKHPYVKDIDFVILLKDEKKIAKKPLFQEFLDWFNSKYFDKVKIIKKGQSYFTFIYLSKKSIPVDVWISYNNRQFDFVVFHYSIGKAIMTYKQIANYFGLSLNRYGLYYMFSKESTPLIVQDFYYLITLIKSYKGLKELLKKIPNKLKEKMSKENKFPEIIYEKNKKQINLFLKSIDNNKIQELVKQNKVHVINEKDKFSVFYFKNKRGEKVLLKIEINLKY